MLRHARPEPGPRSACLLNSRHDEISGFGSLTRPARLPSPAGHAMNAIDQRGLSRRPAAPADLPFLLSLRDTTMTRHFVASGADVTRAEHLQRVMFRYECAEVLERGGKPVGIFKVTRDGLEWQLVQIQVAPELQGQGIGEALIRELIAEARDAGAALTLRVLHANPARRLYERLGFRVFEQGEHDFGMRLDL